MYEPALSAPARDGTLSLCLPRPRSSSLLPKRAPLVTLIPQTRAPSPRFCKAHSLPSLPSTPQAVALYITQLARHVTVAMIRRRLAAINYSHREAGYRDSPASARSNFIVREVLNGIRRTRGTVQHGADPLLADAVKRIAAACPDTLLGTRDRALVLLGFSGAFRRSELTQILEVDDLTFTPQGLYIRLPRSKTDQEQAGRTVAIGLGEHEESCPVRALRAWLTAARIESGPVFRAVDLRGACFSHGSFPEVNLENPETRGSTCRDRSEECLRPQPPCGDGDHRGDPWRGRARDRPDDRPQDVRDGPAVHSRRRTAAEQHDGTAGAIVAP
jgi:hypothetical protein